MGTPIQKRNSKTDKEAKKPISGRHFNLVISIVGAIAIWMYVIGGVDPEITSSGKEVGIQIQNVEALQENKLSLMEVQETDYKVTVWLKGKKSAVDNVAISQIRASADLTHVQSGDNLIPVDVAVPNSVTVARIFPENLEIKAESIIQAQKSVRMVYRGEGPVDTEAQVLSFEPSEVTIEGPQSKIDLVDEMIAAVDLSQIQSDRSLEVDVSPVDAQGTAVQDVELDTDTVRASIALYAVKEAPFEIVLTGGALEDTAVTVTSSPRTVKIKGYPDRLEQIDQIQSKPINQALLTESTELTVTPELPEGVYLARSSPELKASFLVEGLVTTALTYQMQEVAIQGLAEGLVCSLGEGEIQATVKASQKETENVSQSSIQLLLDVEGLDEGEHTAALTYSADEALRVTLEPANITFRISK